jgi:hypothetical protein
MSIDWPEVSDGPIMTNLGGYCYERNLRGIHRGNVSETAK